MKINSLTNLFEHAGLEIEFTRLVTGIAQHQYVLVMRSKELEMACYYKSKILTGISAFNAQEMTLVFLMGQLHRHTGMARLMEHHLNEVTQSHVTTFCDGYRRFLVGEDARKVISKIINDELAVDNNQTLCGQHYVKIDTKQRAFNRLKPAIGITSGCLF